MENSQIIEKSVVNEDTPQSIPSKPRRMEEQDVAKGIAIFLVMALHILVVHKAAYQVLALLAGFIMALFFFLSGLNYKPGKTYKENIIKRIKQILIPFLIYVLIITIIVGSYLMITGQSSFLDILQTLGNCLLGSQFSSQIGLASSSMQLHRCLMIIWFIIMLLSATFIFYGVVDLCLKSLYSFISISILLLSITILLGYLNFSLPFYLREAPTITVIMLFGALFKKYKIFENPSKMWVIINSLVAYGLYLFVAILFRGGGFIMGGRLLGSFGPLEGLITIIYAIFGSYSFLNFCRLLTHVKGLKFILTYLGNNSVYYLLLHQMVKFFVQEIMNYHPSGMMMSSEVTEGLSFLVLFITIVIVTLYIILITFLKKKLKEMKSTKGAKENESIK